MLSDGITLVSGSGMSVEAGPILPLSPSNGQRFTLTAVDGAYTPGDYEYEASSLSWAPIGDITSVTAGTGLSGGGVRGNVSLAIDQAWLDAHSLPIAGGSLAGPLALAADPTLALQAATKQYVDALRAYVDAALQGLDVKASVKVATTANITLSGLQTVDGVALVAGDRVLVKNQTNGAQNGIYVVASAAWSRSSDAATSAAVTTGLYTFVEQGTTQGSSGWNLITQMPITLDTTALVFTQFGAVTAYTPGTNITIAGNQISVANSAFPYDIGTNIVGKPAASDVVLSVPVVRAFSVPAGMSGSKAVAGAAATASAVFSVKKNGVEFGTITFAVSGTAGTFAATTATSFAVGDLLSITAPASQDATLANIGIVILPTLA